MKLEKIDWTAKGTYDPSLVTDKFDNIHIEGYDPRKTNDMGKEETFGYRALCRKDDEAGYQYKKRRR